VEELRILDRHDHRLFQQPLRLVAAADVFEPDVGVGRVYVPRDDAREVAQLDAAAERRRRF
jgi:hypothetical protein